MRDKAAKHESTFDVIIQINDRRQHQHLFKTNKYDLSPNNFIYNQRSNMILDHIQMTTLHCSAKLQQQVQQRNRNGR